MLRLDLNVHTKYSHDCVVPVLSVLDRCRQSGLGLVAITYHNNIRGALEAREAAGFPVILREEVKSSRGDIIGLFLEEAVPPSAVAKPYSRTCQSQTRPRRGPSSFRLSATHILGARGTPENFT